MKEYELNKILDDYVKLPDVFRFYGIEINRAGFCRCPFHNERTASCKVNEFRYNCFGCHKSGNALSFIKDYFELDFKQAIQKLNSDFNLNLLNDNLELTEEQQEKIKKRKIEQFKKTQIAADLDEKTRKYLDAWRNFVIYEPKYENYDINTDEYLVTKHLKTIDPKWWEAKEIIAELDDFAYIHNFNLTEEVARYFFARTNG